MRKSLLTMTTLLILMLPSFIQAAEDETGHPVDDEALEEKGVVDDTDKVEESWITRFRKKLVWQSESGKYRFQAGGLVQLDLTWSAESEKLKEEFGSIDNDAAFRRVRVFTDGLLWSNLRIRFQYDFGEDNGLKDAYLEGQGKHLKFANLRIGQFLEPFSLERQTSNKYRPFLETSLPVSVFSPGRSTGLALFDAPGNQRFTWAVGAFTHIGQQDEDASNSDMTFTGRVTGLPQFDPVGRQLIHVGLSYCVRALDGNEAEYRTRPEARALPHFIDTGLFDAEVSNLLGLEFAIVRGRFWSQVEYIQSTVDSEDTSSSPTFSGTYVQVGWFLTEDTRPYDQIKGSFGREIPSNAVSDSGFRLFRKTNPFKSDKRSGAWEVALRYSTADLDSGSIEGGQLTDWTAALNWYMDSFRRVSLNYIYSSIDDGGTADILLIRGQWDF